MSNLRNEIAKTISEGEMYDCSSGQLADDILALIESQRCEWKVVRGHRDLHWAGCKKKQFARTGRDFELFPFCPCCGRRIEVKDGQ